MTLPAPAPPGSALEGLIRIYRSPMCGVHATSLEGRLLRTDRGAVVDFATGAYLGLDADVTDADVAEVRCFGLRNGWSRATGTSALTRDLEEQLASRLQMDMVRLSTSAALVNYSAFYGLSDAFPIALVDQDAHITLKQGVQGAYPAARRHVFPHDDLGALEGLLAKLPPGPKLVCVDGVYSMKGTFAPVRELVELCVRYGAKLFVDDVHGFGVLGDGGCGIIEEVPVELRRHVILLASFAKSASNPVAFLAYSQEDWVAVEAIPALNYSGPPSNLHAAVCRRHLAGWDALAPRRARIRRASERLHAFCAANGIVTLSPAGSPILAVGVQDAHADRVVEQLFAAGVLGKLAVYPVVRRGDEVLRFCLTAAHTDAHLRTLESALAGVAPMLRRIA